MIVGFPPGGAPDLIARVVAEGLQARTGRTVVVENRPGANGQIAMQATKSPQGGNTTIIMSPAEGITLQPHIKKALPYDTFKDFVPIAAISSNAYGLAVGPLAPVKTIPEFVAWCKAHPDQATYGTPGIGTPHHLLGQAFAKAAGIQYRHIAYRGGADVLQDVQGGTVASVIAALPLLVTRQKPGILTVIGQTGETRDPTLPQVATFAEAGYPSITADGVFGLFTSSKTPASEVKALAEAAREIVAQPAFAQAVARFGQEPHPMAPDAFRDWLAREYQRWGAVVRDVGFTPED